MSNPTEIIPRTAIAAITFTSGGVVQRRVYTQDLDGYIRESRFDGQSWTGGTRKDVIATKPSPDAKPVPVPAKLGSPIAALHLDYKDAIHVFYLTNENIIREVRKDGQGDWYDSNFNDPNNTFKASPASRLAVLGYTRWVHNITLYFQQPDGAIGQISYDSGKWVQGPGIGNKPLIGTGLAAVTFHGTDPEGTYTGIRVYYQLSDGTVTDAQLDRGRDWKDQGDLKLTNAPSNSNLSALSNGTDASPGFQLYFLNKANWIAEGNYYNGAWHFENHPGHTVATPRSDIAVFVESGWIRLYVQDQNNEIAEWSSQSSHAGWKKDAIIPTGNVQ